MTTRLTCPPLLCLMLCLFAGCVSETRRVEQLPSDKVNEVLRVPQQMQDISGDLLRYHAEHRILPAALEVLMEEQIVTPERFEQLPDYLYHPRGLAELRDGRVVVLVDSEVRIEGHAWCIVREPSGAPRTIQLNVTPIALSELSANAKPGN